MGFVLQDDSSISEHEVSQYGVSAPGNGCADSVSLFSRYKNGSSSNGSTKAVAQRVCEKMEDLPSKSEEKVKGLHDSTFRDVRDISN